MFRAVQMGTMCLNAAWIRGNSVIISDIVKLSETESAVGLDDDDDR